MRRPSVPALTDHLIGASPPSSRLYILPHFFEGDRGVDLYDTENVFNRWAQSSSLPEQRGYCTDLPNVHSGL